VHSVAVVHPVAHAPVLHSVYGAHDRAPCGGPLSTLLHVPSLPLTLHAMHGELHALLQQ
jgi:hypothetical protein